MLAPKLSVLHNAFDRKDLSVVAIYIETCGGVPDHASELRRQVKKHKIDYPVLDGEAGTIDDPTRKRFRWAPHAVVIDAKGLVVQTYGHMPGMEPLREDLEALVATGWIEPRLDDGWRAFRRGAWVETRIDDGDGPRLEVRRLKKVSRDGVTLDVLVNGERLKEEKLLHTRTPIKRTRRVLAGETLTVGEQALSCRVVETITEWKNGRSEVKVWYATEVPGHEVKRVRKVEKNGREMLDSSRVVAFGLSGPLPAR